MCGPYCLALMCVCVRAWVGWQTKSASPPCSTIALERLVGLCESFLRFPPYYKENILGFCNPSSSPSKPQSPQRLYGLQCTPHHFTPTRHGLLSCWRQSELEQEEHCSSPRGAGGLIMLFLTSLRGGISLSVSQDHRKYTHSPYTASAHTTPCKPTDHLQNNTLINRTPLNVHDSRWSVDLWVALSLTSSKHTATGLTPFLNTQNNSVKYLIPNSRCRPLVLPPSTVNNDIVK